MFNKDSLMKTMLELVSVPSISSTENEYLGGEKICEIMTDIPYFKKNIENLNMIPIPGDPYHRSFVSALFKSKKKTQKTVLLIGHYDVVDVEEYGHLKGIAFNPIEYTKRVLDLSLDEDAKADLESGDWLFGRGVNDMKMGVALNLEMIRELSSRDTFKGNILFLAVPGEESNSEGMLAAAKYLADLKNKGLNYIGLLLPEPYILDSKEDTRRHIHTGSCGKIMPMFMFVGKETHVSAPFSGIDPNLMASELNRLFDLNPDFCSTSLGTVTQPPICLKQTDLKDIYSVKTAIYAASYYNMTTLNLSCNKLITQIKELAYQAFENSIEILKDNLARFKKLNGSTLDLISLEPCVMTFKELYCEVKELYGEKFDKYLNNKILDWQDKGYDIQTMSIQLMKETYERYPNKKPMIIIGFAPPYYPDRIVNESTEGNKKVLNMVEDLIEYAKVKYNEDFVKDSYFMGISDLSYTGLKKDFNIDEIISNMPGFGRYYNLPIDSLKELDIPGIVLGPYGKDFHKYTERLNIPFSFDVLPDLYEYAIEKLFEEKL